MKTKLSLCCMAKPANLPGGLSSIEIGICPNCQEHTEFVDMAYKVIHDYGDFYTEDQQEAKAQFDQWKKDGCDGIRLYEAINEEEPDWELIDYCDRYEETYLD